MTPLKTIQSQMHLEPDGHNWLLLFSEWKIYYDYNDQFTTLRKG